MIHHLIIFLVGVLVGFAGSLYFFYRRAGKVPIVGGMIQDKIEEGLGLHDKPDNPKLGKIGLRERKPREE